MACLVCPDVQVGNRDLSRCRGPRLERGVSSQVVATGVQTRPGCNAPGGPRRGSKAPGGLRLRGADRPEAEVRGRAIVAVATGPWDTDWRSPGCRSPKVPPWWSFLVGLRAPRAARDAQRQCGYQWGPCTPWLSPSYLLCNELGVGSGLFLRMFFLLNIRGIPGGAPQWAELHLNVALAGKDALPISAVSPFFPDERGGSSLDARPPAGATGEAPKHRSIHRYVRSPKISPGKKIGQKMPILDATKNPPSPNVLLSCYSHTFSSSEEMSVIEYVGQRFSIPDDLISEIESFEELVVGESEVCGCPFEVPRNHNWWLYKEFIVECIESEFDICPESLAIYCSSHECAEDFRDYARKTKFREELDAINHYEDYVVVLWAVRLLWEPPPDDMWLEV
ncbi:hypothetical protein M569_17735 [Genlisea aurea]|uniref:Uncharacterized protein n=1 Tax=Genlisea aurea TaxID=192259 RepID=S8BR33_9LAMI|nr:hypothetical protein M569_17735 [Genlisea aurea]